MIPDASHHSPSRHPFRKRMTMGWDVWVVAVLAFAQLQITSLAEIAVLPTRVQDVFRHPRLGGVLSTQAISAFGEVGPRPGEPIGLLLIALTIGFVILYALIDYWGKGIWQQRSKWLLLILIIATAIYLPTVKLILLRQQSGPASYSHDGGVIQTEATIQFLFAGKNPYTENYTQTPMAEWGLSQYRTALYHYPYLPWTFLFSAPFYWVGQKFGMYDQRIVYLLLMAVALLLAPRLVQDMRRKLALVAALALNPLMGLDLLFGQNDSFIFCWILFALVAIQRRTRSATVVGMIFFGFACASKPTAWFLAPFLGLLLVADAGPLLDSWRGLMRVAPRIFWRATPAMLVFAAITLPYAVWDGWSLYDDVWRWSNGKGETGYQIWGWGASNFVLGLGLVQDRFAQWNFLLLEVLFAIPLLLWLLQQQRRRNTLAVACWHYALFLLLFFYVSRFLNENYLGYVLAFLTVGFFADE